jgi:copper chaperone CopZ
MKSIQFKTNLKCNGCINAIKPNIEAIKEIKSWRVFLDVQEKTLEVDFENSTEEEIANAVQKVVKEAGYIIEKM